MEKCEQCGNGSPYCFVIEAGGKRHTFDSFECAIFAMAPACGHCGCRILGHGVEVEPAQSGELEERQIYCCRHCAQSHQAALLASSPEPAQR